MSTIEATDYAIHTHFYDSERSAWQCRTCDTASDDCEGMTEAEADELTCEGFNLDAFRAWCDQTGAAFTYDNRHDFADAFCGEWDNFAEYADGLADELMDAEGLPADSIARRHFDYSGFARDLLLGGDNFIAEAPAFGAYVFRSV